jgi:hypothetical protein
MVSDVEFKSWVKSKLEEGFSKDKIKDLIKQSGYSNYYVKLIEQMVIVQEREKQNDDDFFKPKKKIITKNVREVFFNYIKFLIVILILILIVFVVVSFEVGKVLVDKIGSIKLKSTDEITIPTDLESCSKLGSGGYENCVIDRVRLNNDLLSFDVCNSIKTIELKDSCMFLLITKTNNVTSDVCANALGYGSICYQKLAKITGNEMYCEMAADREQCIREII